MSSGVKAQQYMEKWMVGENWTYVLNQITYIDD